MTITPIIFGFHRGCWKRVRRYDDLHSNVSASLVRQPEDISCLFSYSTAEQWQRSLWRYVRHKYREPNTWILLALATFQTRRFCAPNMMQPPSHDLVFAAHENSLFLFEANCPGNQRNIFRFPPVESRRALGGWTGNCQKLHTIPDFCNEGTCLREKTCVDTSLEGASHLLSVQPKSTRKALLRSRWGKYL